MILAMERSVAYDEAVVDIDDHDELLVDRPVEAGLVWVGHQAVRHEEARHEREPP